MLLVVIIVIDKCVFFEILIIDEVIRIEWFINRLFLKIVIYIFWKRIFYK